MMLLTGTLPYKDFPLTFGQPKLEGDSLIVDSRRFSCTQGTGAMVTAALKVTEYFKVETPYVLVAGDIGEGKGTRELFQYLTDKVKELSPGIVVLHYCLPIMALVKRFCQAAEGCENKPFLVADAGGMYAAKASKMAVHFDIFTPDPMEMAFLADSNAIHPAYLSRHLLGAEASKIPELIAMAYRNKDAAKLLIVKGETDYIAVDGRVVYSLKEPNIPALEPIGGTGDTITGLVSGFVYAGYKPIEAAVMAIKTNRKAGELVMPTPATPVRKIIDKFPEVFAGYIDAWKEGLPGENR